MQVIIQAGESNRSGLEILMVPSLTWYGSQALDIRGVGGDTVENVDQNQEDSDQERHSTRNYLWRNQKTDLHQWNFSSLIKGVIINDIPTIQLQTTQKGDSSLPSI